jgi:hypothetical protein
LDKLDALIKHIRGLDDRRKPQAQRQRLAHRLREAAAMLDPDPAAPARVLEAFRALRAIDFDGMYPLDRTNFAAACRRWALVADPRLKFHKGGTLSERLADTAKPGARY